MTNIHSRIAAIRKEIASTCQLANRDPDSVNLLAVSKTMGADAVASAIRAGQKHFGENYLQDALPKVSAFPEATWHFVGAIQSNKTRDIANRFGWVHGIATEKVARRLSEQREPTLGKLNCLIQVNLSFEDQKSGVNPDEAIRLAAQVEAFDQISLRGLMTMPAPTNDHSAQAATFRTLRELKDDIQSRYDLPEFNQLSMGMTNDFVEAIKEGATWIRIGTAIFGPRTSAPTSSTTTTTKG
ncbi:MAG: YggS family pyridoxal phosphate-dependent enzyme [Candidatus Azotimanducaceae bacterium WSBS_2022_MAG_OTU7]